MEAEKFAKKFVNKWVRAYKSPKSSVRRPLVYTVNIWTWEKIYIVYLQKEKSHWHLLHAQKAEVSYVAFLGDQNQIAYRVELSNELELNPRFSLKNHSPFTGGWVLFKRGGKVKIHCQKNQALDRQLSNSTNHLNLLGIECQLLLALPLWWSLFQMNTVN